MGRESCTLAERPRFVRIIHIWRRPNTFSLCLNGWDCILPRRATAGQCEWVWWHNLTDFLNHSNYRAFHSVQRQLRILGRPEEKILWRNLPITIWTKTVPDSVLDDESLPYWERMELSVTQLDRNEALLGIKGCYSTVQFVKDALLHNIK